MDIKHNKQGKGGYFYYEKDGHEMAKMVYAMDDNDRMIIEHTEVDRSLEGHGIGQTLLEKLIDYARLNNIKVVPVCVFASAMFKKHKEWQDVL